ncbi:MAG: hypothetical protein JW797_11855 [Bradymonadales bacterium]|nr:hypothetical protein [Bradymonadales bacterium]
MEFEGIRLSGASDVRYHILAETSTRPFDERPWDWVVRFARAHPEHQDWVEQGILAVIDEIGGRQLRPTDMLDEMVRLSEQCHVEALFQRLRDRLLQPLEGWTPGEVGTFLGWLIGFHAGQRLRPIADRIREHGNRAETFAEAFILLTHVDGAMAAQLVEEAIGPVMATADDPEYLLSFVAGKYLLDEMAPHRAAIVAAIEREPEEIGRLFREAVANEALDPEESERFLAEFDELRSTARSSSIDLSEQSTQGDFVKDDQNEEVGAGLIPPELSEPATAVVEEFVLACQAGDVPRARLAVLHPDDGKASGLGEVFEEYAQGIQDGLPRYMEGFPKISRIVRVGPAEPFEMPGSSGEAASGSAPQETVTVLWVPVTMEVGGVHRQERFLVYRIGSSTKIGLFLAQPGEK